MTSLSNHRVLAICIFAVAVVASLSQHQEARASPEISEGNAATGLSTQFDAFGIEQVECDVSLLQTDLVKESTTEGNASPSSGQKPAGIMTTDRSVQEHGGVKLLQQGVKQGHVYPSLILQTRWPFYGFDPLLDTDPNLLRKYGSTQPYGSMQQIAIKEAEMPEQVPVAGIVWTIILGLGFIITAVACTCGCPPKWEEENIFSNKQQQQPDVYENKGYVRTSNTDQPNDAPEIKKT